MLSSMGGLHKLVLIYKHLIVSLVWGLFKGH
jgi:hypothetical protein